MRGSLKTTRIVVVTSTTGNARTNTRVARLRRTPTAKPHQPRAPATFEEPGTAMVGAPDWGVKENSPIVTSTGIGAGNRLDCPLDLAQISLEATAMPDIEE